jgi:hypothetical protein
MANGIRQHVSDAAGQRRIALDRHRLVAVLEEVPDALVCAVETLGVARTQTRHQPRERRGARPNHEVAMVREQAPGENDESELANQEAKARQEVLGVCIAREDRATLHAADHHVVDRAFYVRA